VAGRTRQPARSVHQLHKSQIGLQHNNLPVCLVTHRSVRQLHKSQIGLQHNNLPVCWFTHRYNWVPVRMRIIYVAAAVGISIAVLFIAPVVLLMGASSAHADSKGYLRCIGSDAEPPLGPAREWSGSVRVIETRLNSGESPAQAAQVLTGMGVKPNDAAAQVQCVLANWP
jgi:hypothetical protein